MSEKIGILLVNLGTPASTSISDVRAYLKDFLLDPRVVTLPWLARQILVRGLILPFRPKKTAVLYEKIWTKEGSPLLIHTQALTEKLQTHLDHHVVVTFGMRYGNPSIEAGLDHLLAQGCDTIKILPLFPQYSSATTGSVMEVIFKYFQQKTNLPNLQCITDFFNHPLFIQALAASAKITLDTFKPDLLLMSYHGLPERQIIASEGPMPTACHQGVACPPLSNCNRFCYRAQCYATSRALAATLNLKETDYSVSFQSRLGRTPWIKPYTDTVLPDLYAKGVRRLAVICPSFVSDCLETLEEIGIRAKEQWMALGGTDFCLVPCLNEDPTWIEALATICR